MVMGLDSEKVCLGFCLGLNRYLVYEGSNMDVVIICPCLRLCWWGVCE